MKYRQDTVQYRGDRVVATVELRHCRLEQCGVGERCSGGEMERRRGNVDWERIDRRGDTVDSRSRGDMEWS